MAEYASLSSSLLLIPTQLELNHISDRFPENCEPRICGFGPITSGIETTRLLAAGSYERVVLLGIAGSYDLERAAVGSACSFQRVGCYGIGAGEAEHFQSAGEIGLEASDELPLQVATSDVHDMLLTVCSAASNANEVKRRRVKFPDSVAEDMEAYSVAMAATKFGLPTTVVRGVSNLAGDRDHSAWQIQEAMESALNLLKTAEF